MNFYDVTDIDETCMDTGIAIIGMSGRFPNADGVQSLWNAVVANERLSQKVDKSELLRWHYNDDLIDHPDFVPAGGWLGDVSGFDADFFGMSPQEARINSPQLRLFLDQSLRALEHAGYGLAQVRASATGVFAGSNLSTYLINNIMPSSHFGKTDPLSLAIANDKDHLANQVAYRLNLKGPAVNVQTACSTSLVAVHLACQSLLNFESDLALAGGSNVALPEQSGYLFAEGGILARDGICRPFCAEATGTLPANGVAVVVLKRLADAIEDGDDIQAIIRGTAINNDGREKVGYTAPSVSGQSSVIAEALSVADVDPAQIGYLEAHGTGTALGDPIELHALKDAWGEGFKVGDQPCAIGSLKGTVGHMDTAAGVSGLIKAALCLKHEYIPGMPNFTQPNPDLHLDDSRIYIPAEGKPWVHDGQRMAAVSSFGIGGTNAHAILQAPPRKEAVEPRAPSARPAILALSGPNADSVKWQCAQCSELAAASPTELDLMEKSLLTDRKVFAHKASLVVSSQGEAHFVAAGPASNDTHPKRSKTAFLFSGQGSQFAQMGAQIYQREPFYKQAFDECCDLFVAAGSCDPRVLLFSTMDEDVDIDRTDRAQPLLFATHYSFAKLLSHWGVKPDALLGHSIGEISAATLAGVMSLPDAVRLVTLRASMMNAAPRGAMLAVGLSEDNIRSHLSSELDIAAINGPDMTVVSGSEARIDALREDLKAHRVITRKLAVSHAYHSRMMEPAMQPIDDLVAQITLNAPKIPYISNVTGTWITDAQAQDPTYWSCHMRNAVQFSDGLSEVLAAQCTYFIECGPGETLINMVKAQARNAVSVSKVVTAKANDCVSLYTTLAQAWGHHHDVNLATILAPSNPSFERGGKVCMPAIPKNEQRYWIDAPYESETYTAPQGDAPIIVQDAAPLASRPTNLGDVSEPYNMAGTTLCKIWSDAIGIAPVGIDDDYFTLGGTSVLAVQICARAKAEGLDISPNQMLQAGTIRLILQDLDHVSGPENAVSSEVEHEVPSGISPDQLAAIIAQTGG